ncbi:MAG: B12-binding domain-containing radical SAM protein [Candidatus Omnitrophica bacterium]|nr:B12-binding domain-containing radical SAM protein [Candidatus Omnitrophota bacterium]
MMRVKLISPRSPVMSVTPRDRAIQFSRLTLTTVAALFPSEVDIRIINDSIDEIDFDEKVDMVGITSITCTAPRAYEIADEFRKRKVPVIMGGIHPSALPQEAALHSDAVVIGEAEGIIDKLLSDFKKGRLEKFYSSSERVSLLNLPLPRRDLLSGNKYYKEMDLVQTTRGCPFNCDFCSVSDFFGCTYRTRPIPDIIREVKLLKNRAVIFFVDDNIAGQKDYARELFNALIPLKVRWFSQASIIIARDTELLKLAARSGCKALFIGFESISSNSLRQVGKSMNRVNEYKEGIKRLHDNGIGVIGAFIFGFDSDTNEVFDETIDFIESNRIELASFSILTPLPGTRLYKKLDEEKRIFERDWSKYTCGEVVFKPKLLSVEQLQEGYYLAREKISSYNSIFRRTFNFGRRSLIFFPLNLVMRKASRASLKKTRQMK